METAEAVQVAASIKRYAKAFNKVVVWGLRSQWHSHRFIHQAFVKALKHAGVPVAWTDFGASPDIIEPGDFVITSNAHGRMTKGETLAPFKEGVYYCFHGFGHPGYAGTDRRQRHPVCRKYALDLEVYTDAALAASDRWGAATHFDEPTKTLYQAWGTNLLPHEFRAPTFAKMSPLVFWIGAIWMDALGQGNLSEINELRYALQQHGLRFVRLKFVPNWTNEHSVRLSRIAPAIGGRWQVEHNYLPCRMFKNVSYGALGISNVKKFAEVYEGCSVPGETIADLVGNALSLSRRDALELTALQQQVTLRHTYLHKLDNIFQAMFDH